jgi:hypothetical protein
VSGDPNGQPTDSPLSGRIPWTAISRVDKGSQGWQHGGQLQALLLGLAACALILIAFWGLDVLGMRSRRRH